MLEGKELGWLLGFFSKNLRVQWCQVPGAMNKTWLSVGDTEAEVDQPIKLLAMVLSERLNGCHRFLISGSESPAFEVLWQLRILLAYFLLEGSYDVVFSKLSEPDQLHEIWGVVSRLCRVALEEPEVTALQGRDFDFLYFLEKYGTE